MIKRGQVWKSKDSGKVIKIVQKKSGNGHWLTDNGHIIHFGTLKKFWELQTKDKL